MVNDGEWWVINGDHGFSINGGTPIAGMAYFMENPSMEDLGVPTF